MNVNTAAIQLNGRGEVLLADIMTCERVEERRQVRMIGPVRLFGDVADEASESGYKARGFDSPDSVDGAV